MDTYRLKCYGNIILSLYTYVIYGFGRISTNVHVKLYYYPHYHYLFPED